MEYIDMDESEMYGSAVSEDTLLLVAAILGPEVKDKLLYPVVYPVVDEIVEHRRDTL
jgi:hypothetical protein